MQEQLTACSSKNYDITTSKRKELETAKTTITKERQQQLHYNYQNNENENCSSKNGGTTNNSFFISFT